MTTSDAKCWGWRDYGALGDGSSGLSAQTSPVNVIGLSGGVGQISAGDHVTCAMTLSGSALCWGWNGYGSVGDGTTTQRNTPVYVSGLGSGVLSVSTGRHHACAVLLSGTVCCWGWNDQGQVGDGATASRLTPFSIPGLSSIVSVSCGHKHTCAVNSTGSVWCWGQNHAGQVGDGTTTRRLTPVLLADAGNVKFIEAGGWHQDGEVAHTCGLLIDGNVTCWGHGGFGALGDGSGSSKLSPGSLVMFPWVSPSPSSSPTPSVTPSVTRTSSVTPTVTATPSPSPTVNWTALQAGGVTVANVTAGGYHSCGLLSSGDVMCWGLNSYGQIGDGSFV
jgi:alpha-tubulin suppressor-like RCC1 family protein